MTLQPTAPHADPPSTLVDVVRLQARTRGDRTAYIFLRDGNTEEARITFAELEAKARAIAATLVRGSKTPVLGERALLLYAPGLDFIAAFLGCLFAGVVPVPVVPPQDARSAPKCLAVAKDCGASIVMTTSALLATYQGWLHEQAYVRASWHGTDAVDPAAAADWTPPAIHASTIAFLQYTSGSTGTPKGVVVTHGNILANQRIIQSGCAHSDSTVIVGWLPLFHDMGLIGHVFQPLYLGVLSVLMPPLAFLQKPARWLEAITRYRATTSGAPNFAYEICVTQIPEERLANFDLSSWDVAYIGAEPVRADTLERFTRKFAKCGFRRSSMYPCYGLAEATLFVTGGPKGESSTVDLDPEVIEQGGVHVLPPHEGASKHRTFVACGRTWEDQQLAIVHPETGTKCDPNVVGEIWLAGASVARGYWQRSEETERTFGARLEGSDGRWCRTGDLGFVRDGLLYVTGRLKDIVIIRGRNHYPQDIELTVERAHPALAAGGGAAFSVDVEEAEQLVVVHEIDSGHRHDVDQVAIEKAVRRAISDAHGLAVGAIRLLKPRTIPKTSSGKIRRRACRDLFLKGALDEIADAGSIVVADGVTP